ncbi:MAG TPA: hypothetical protein PKH01_05000 [Pseudomonadales bacterium]|nr:hypothetical protein [Pseudomonadales bacterium]HNL92237.1 hypothetical protein [Pseudomonadales bacterium]
MATLFLLSACQIATQDSDTAPQDSVSASEGFWPWQKEDRKANIKEMRKQHKVLVLMERGDLAFSKDRLNAPQHDNALLYYYTALKVDRGNKAALRGLNKVAQRFRDLATTAHNNGNDSQSSQYLQQAEMITGANDPANITLRTELRTTPSGQKPRELGRELQKRLKAKKDALKEKNLLNNKNLLDDALAIPVEDEE